MNFSAKSIFDGCLDMTMSPEQQLRLGMHIVNRVRGDGNYDPHTNGEYWALQKIKWQFRNQDIIMIDAGAHIGEWTLEALSGLTPKSTIYSFEPAEATFAQLQKNVATKTTTARATPFHAALSDVDGYGTLHVDGDLHGTNSLHRHHLRVTTSAEILRSKKQETITLVRGDTFCRRQNIDRIHLLKIDTEGHEVPVLRGFSEMLSQKKIDYVQFEYFHGWIDAGFFLHEAIQLLNKAGYITGKLVRDHLLFLDCYDKSYEKFEFSNFFAIRDSKLSEFWKK